MRTPGDGADYYSRTCHHKQLSTKINGVPARSSSEGAQYATLDQTKVPHYSKY